MAKAKATAKEPARPPYVLAAGPTFGIVEDVTNGDEVHVWDKGSLTVAERIPIRAWSCTCGAVGYSVEFTLRPDIWGAS